MTTLSRASSIRCTGPIGMQPCVRPVATAIPGASISPAIPLLPRPLSSSPASSSGVRPTSGLAQRCDTRPPTRKAPLAVASVDCARFARSGQRGSAWTSANARLRRLDPGGMPARQLRTPDHRSPKRRGSCPAAKRPSCNRRRLVENFMPPPSRHRARHRRPRKRSRCRSARARTSWGNAGAAGSLT